jgi:hypothetical protein
MLTITSVLIILGLLFGGTGVAAVAAQDSMPGEALYTVKITTEDLRFIFNNSAEAKLDGALEFVNHRVAEATAMAEQGEVYTKQEWEMLAERLEKNLKDALLAVAAAEDPEAGLTKIKSQIHIWELVDYKPDRDRDGTYNAEEVGAPTYRYTFQNMMQRMLQLVDEGLEDPNQFQETFQHRFGKDAKELDLMGASGEEGGQPIDGADPQGAKTKSGADQDYGPDGNPFGAQNKGVSPEFKNENQGDGYGPAGVGVGNQNQAGGSDSQNQGGNGSQKP